MKKILHLEIIRILAILCIMFIHTGFWGHDAYSCTDSHITFIVSLLLACVSAIGVDLFWMVSGSLLLGIDEDISVVYKKRLPRILIVLAVFSVIRYFYDFFMEDYGGGVYWSRVYGDNAGTGLLHIGLGDFAKKFLSGNVYLPYWFLYYYIGILLLLPFIRKVVKGMSTIEWKYFAVFEVCFLVIVKLFEPVIHTRFGVPFFIPEAVNAFVLGYAAEKVVPAEWIKKRKNLVLLFLVSVVFVAVEYTFSVKLGNPIGEGRNVFTDMFIQPLAFCVVLIIRGISLNLKMCSERLYKVICVVGSCTFGLYLIEEYLRDILFFIYDALVPMVTVMPACIIWLLCCFIVGVPVVCALKKLPLIGKLI
ncbi:acyltransferase [Butyrivibrio sp. NC2007]|uniref:acyltransferase n=1 Tax=Butyrivibrio sp. NC2007 TaxID=1280683 RepID=UPI0009DBA253|nr:acyltransferase family protein [Butyrivibrio sp. NC2007]